MTLETSETVDSLFGALAKAQGMFDQPKKTHENPFFHSKYADLADIISATRPGLVANELCIIQGAVAGDGGVVVVPTRLAHSSGQWLQFDVTLPTGKGDAQAIGSAITYARRYGWSAVTGVASEEDDDGNSASGGGSATTRPAQRAPAKAAAKPAQAEKEGWRKLLEAELTQWADSDLLSPDEGKILHKKLSSNFNDEAIKALHRETLKIVLERKKALDVKSDEGAPSIPPDQVETDQIGIF